MDGRFSLHIYKVYNGVYIAELIIFVTLLYKDNEKALSNGFLMLLLFLLKG